MGFLSGLFSGGDTIKGTLEGAGSLAKDLRSAITGDISPEKKAEIEAKAQEIEASLQKAQVELNMAEAQSGNVFVAGWRPFLGWVFGVIIALHYLALPIAEWTLSIFAPTVLPLPAFDLTDIWPVLIGMLGFGGLRTYEKARGVHGRH
nr:hypothetical protein 15 [Spirochaetaceae bacterium]